MYFWKNMTGGIFHGAGALFTGGSSSTANPQLGNPPVCRVGGEGRDLKDADCDGKKRNDDDFLD